MPNKLELIQNIIVSIIIGGLVGMLLAILLTSMENRQECKLAAIEHNYAAVEALAICGDL